jgi:hypothetical protein
LHQLAETCYTTHVTIHRTRASIAQSLGQLLQLLPTSAALPQNHRVDQNRADFNACSRQGSCDSFCCCADASQITFLCFVDLAQQCYVAAPHHEMHQPQLRISSDSSSDGERSSCSNISPHLSSLLCAAALVGPPPRSEASVSAPTGECSTVENVCIADIRCNNQIELERGL